MSHISKNPSSVLVVEDEVFICACTVLELQDAGFTVIATHTAPEALEAFLSHPEVTAVFTDVNMPGAFDGLSLARQIAKLRPKVQVIITSGRGQPPACEMPKGSQFLAKPYESRMVTALLDAA